jgi:hypothetical protein
VLFFAAGDDSVEADSEVFFVVEDFFLAEVDVACVVVPVDVVADSSCFCVWQPRNAVNVSAVIKDKTDVFIFGLSLTRPRMSIIALQGKH